MNGVTEAMVKSIKRALNVTVGDHVMEFSVLQTVMFEAAELVNSRPIGKHPSNPDDGTYLCPNDLLLGRSSNKVPQGPFQIVNHKRRFQFLQSLVDSFWKKWTRDYFPNLIIRSKWHVEKRNVEKGDVVLIKDNKSLRGDWKQGIVFKLFPSLDDRIRKVTVAYKNLRSDEPLTKYNGVNYTYIERPVHNLIVLNAVNDE